MAKARILAIDDQLYFRSYLEGLLQEEGYEVLTADGGPAGLELLDREGPFDLVLIDLIMPEMDGLEFVRHVRERWADPDIIMVTSVGDVRRAVAAIRGGAADYLLKPIDREDLLRAIESRLEQRRLRREHERLLAENLSFLGLLSVVERGLGMLSRLGRREIAEELLELLCLESKAQAGILWVRQGGEPEPAEFVRAAVRGNLRPKDRPERLPPLTDSRATRLRNGEVDRVTNELRTAGPVLWVPSVRAPALWAVARLSDPVDGRFSEGLTETCAKLGTLAAIAFANADRTEELERRGLREVETGLHTRSYLEEVAAREIHRGQRYGRSFVVLCIEVDARADGERDPEATAHVTEALKATVRAAEVVASEPPARFWVLVPEADPIGSAAVKRRLEGAVATALGGDRGFAIGAASFPGDGDTFDTLAAAAVRRLEADRVSLVRKLGLGKAESLAEIARRLRYEAEFMPDTLVSDALQLVLDEVRNRPDSRGLIFLAPGVERAAVLAPLAALGEQPVATEVFVATDADTVPSGQAVTALPLPSGVSADTTWILRFGEASPYLLLAGPPGGARGRPVFHSDDPSLVEHVAFKLRTEAGFGAGSTP